MEVEEERISKVEEGIASKEPKAKHDSAICSSQSVVTIGQKVRIFFLL